MAKSGSKKTAAEIELVVILASGMSGRQAAAETGIPYRTVSRRQADPEFRHAVSVARSAMISQAAGKLAVQASTAVVAVVKLLESKDERTVLSASRTILEHCVRFVEVVDLAERIEALEQRRNTDGSI